MSTRARTLQERLSAHSLDALVVSAPTNIQYLTGFTGSNGTVVVTPHATTLITDSRYRTWASEQVQSHDPATVVVIAQGTGRQALNDQVGDCSTVGLESDHVTWTDAKSLSELFGADRVVATSRVVEDLREIKSANEIVSLRSAGAVGDAALERMATELAPGMSEQDVARRIAQLMYDHSRVVPSFDIIVASGPNSANPHHAPTDRLIVAGDLVIIDSGATVDGYRSDMTRSFVLGEPTQQQREMLSLVKVAQQAGVDAVAPGVPTSEIDAACRQVIADAGYGEYFTHGTGHGVGLDIHEAPSVSSASTATLAPGHIITVEPGVYIPSVGGVRWEDTVLVTSNGADSLTNSPKQPIVEL